MDLRKLKKEEEGKRQQSLKKRISRDKFRPKIVDVFPDLPVPEASQSVTVPRGFIVNRFGVRDEVDEKNIIIASPLVIVRKFCDITTSQVMVSLWFWTPTGWTNKVVSRDAICDKRKILELSKYGLAVTNDNAMEVVRYLSEFERQNAASIEVAKATNRPVSYTHLTLPTKA